MKYEIEIPDLPEGWKPIAYRRAERGKDYALKEGKVSLYNGFSDFANLIIVERIQPRRIVLEETYEFRKAKPGEYYEYYEPFGGTAIHKSHTDTSGEYKIWRVVEEGE